MVHVLNNETDGWGSRDYWGEAILFICYTTTVIDFPIKKEQTSIIIDVVLISLSSAGNTGRHQSWKRKEHIPL